MISKAVLILCSLFTTLTAQAGVMSDLDLQTREELGYYFSQQNIELENIEIFGFVTPHNTAICDIEVGAWVTYFNKKGKKTGESCYVCFSIQDPGTHKQSVDPEVTYCLE